MLDATHEPVPAEVAYAGEWRIEPAQSDDTVTFTLRYPPSASNQSSPVAIADLGLTIPALAGDEHPLQFEVRREAGTFVCRGTAGEGRGSGTFRFRPDPAYATRIAQTGLPPLTLPKQVVAGMFDVSTSFVNAIVSAGLPGITFSQVLMLKMFRVAPDDASALHTAFPNEPADDILALKMIGVTPGYVAALQRAKIRDVSAGNVSALRASGVDQPFIEDLAAKGRHGLSIDEVVSLRADGSWFADR